MYIHHQNQKEFNDILEAGASIPVCDANERVQLSIAISLKRIADVLEKKPQYRFAVIASNGIEICGIESEARFSVIRKEFELMFGNCTLRPLP